jgi:hypothetical protein
MLKYNIVRKFLYINTCMYDKNPYLCNVFFMVLDLF